MCGAETQLFLTEIEGTELNVCKKCAQHGKIIKRVRFQTPKQKKKQEKKAKIKEKEVIFTIVDDYAKQIKNKREKLNLKQEELAKKLAEKESLIHKIESGHFEPSIDLARKLEKFLHIRIIEQREVENVDIKKKKSGSFTIGDLIKIRKR